MFLQKHYCWPYLEINLLQLRFVSFIFQSNHPAWWSLTWCTLGFPVSLSGLKRPLVSNNIIYITQSRSRAGFTPSRLNWKINSRQVLIYLSHLFSVPCPALRDNPRGGYQHLRGEASRHRDSCLVRQCGQPRLGRLDWLRLPPAVWRNPLAVLLSGQSSASIIL